MGGSGSPHRGQVQSLDHFRCASTQHCFFYVQAYEVKMASLQSQHNREANCSLAAEGAADVVRGQLQEQRSQVKDLVLLNKAMQVCNLFTVCCYQFYGILVRVCVGLRCTSWVIHSRILLWNLAADNALVPNLWDFGQLDGKPCMICLHAVHFSTNGSQHSDHHPSCHTSLPQVCHSTTWKACPVVNGMHSFLSQCHHTPSVVALTHC